jgi:Mg2+/Co2+ transporter CorB
MAKYETLLTTDILPNGTMLPSQHLPELVHLDDPALEVMTDFTLTPPHAILPTDTMDHAIHQMKVLNVHLLLVINEEGHFQGILSSEDVWGEKPIKLLQERRIQRDQILVRAIMVPYNNITALDFDVIKMAKVGHIVKTLTEHRQQYALAVTPGENNNVQFIRGIFTASQISKQLHKDIND